MAQRDYFKEFEELLQQSQDVSNKVKAMQNDISSVLVENAELKIENENLRNKLNKKPVDDVSQAHQNLEKLYNKGYHICRPMYGAYRQDNEECAFCLGILNGTDTNYIKN